MTRDEALEAAAGIVIGLMFEADNDGAPDNDLRRRAAKIISALADASEAIVAERDKFRDTVNAIKATGRRLRHGRKERKRTNQQKAFLQIRARAEAAEAREREAVSVLSLLVTDIDGLIAERGEFSDWLGSLKAARDFLTSGGGKNSATYTVVALTDSGSVVEHVLADDPAAAKAAAEKYFDEVVAVFAGTHMDLSQEGR